MKLLIVDGASVMMRLVHAMVPGELLADHPAVVEQVPAIMSGTERLIRECAAEAKATHAIVALDSVESWRKQLYPEYKGNRVATTAIWNNRLAAYCREHAELMTMRALGFEADDVIATIVSRAARAGHSTAVLSGDSDLLMLASIFCDIYQFGRKDKGEPRFVKRTMEYVKEKYGLRSAKDLRGYKAMVGEPSDNLPGLEGVGKVKAKKLLEAHDTIDGVLASGALAVEQVSMLNLMLQLVTLDETISVDLLPVIVPAQCKLPSSQTRES